jgi:hypothetical protein
MPNWCNNKLTIKHTNPEMVRKVIEAWNSGKFCNTFIPIPPALLLPDKQGLTEEQNKELKKQNLEKYGFETWYEFRNSKWGIKWDFGAKTEKEKHSVDADSLYVEFDTPWGPPEMIYTFLVSEGYEIVALYAEPNMDFCGYFRTPEDNECYSFWDKSCPEFIDKAFNIFAFVDEVNAEEEEEAKERYVNEGYDDNIPFENTVSSGETAIEVLRRRAREVKAELAQQ